MKPNIKLQYIVRGSTMLGFAAQPTVLFMDMTI